MVKDVYFGKTLRKSFARHEEVLEMPNLLEIQKKSYQWFLDTGLQEVFRDVASIGDYAGNLELSFIDFTMDEILDPKGWVLLHYLMDARTGLGRFHHFRISNYDLMMELIDYCLDHDIDEILELPDVKERVELYFEQAEQFKAQLRRIARVHDKVVVLDLRKEEVIHAGNRFMIYALYPETEISVHVAWGFRKQNTAVMIGKSIVNKASQVDIGELCLQYGGGGHRNAGTCQMDNDVVDEKLPDIIRALNG